MKKDGKALYEYARAGEEVEREARDVVVWTLELGLGEAPDTLKLLAKVSKGTYIRTLGEDIGEALGCGAHLTSLRRIATGHFDISQMHHAGRAGSHGAKQERLACLHAGRFPAARPHACHAGRGQCRPLPERPAPARRAGRTTNTSPSSASNPRALLGTAHIKAGELIPGRLLSPPEIAQILESNL